MNANRPVPAARQNTLNRAVAASAGLVLAVATATGFFVAKIARSYAAPANDGGSAGTVDQQGSNGFDQNGFGQLSQPQQDQPPAGRSHGS
jgi:hypothetical protein